MVGTYRTFKSSFSQIWGTKGGLILFVQEVYYKQVARLWIGELHEQS